MKRFKRPLFILIPLLATVAYFSFRSITNKNHHIKVEKHSTESLIKVSREKKHNHHSHSHSHSHDDNKSYSPNSNLVLERNYEVVDSSENNNIYKKQIDFFKRTYFRHLSDKVSVKVSVKKILKDKIILIVRTKNENGIDRSFESIVDKKTGKRIVNQGFSINENKKIAKKLKFFPSGLLINKK